MTDRAARELLRDLRSPIVPVESEDAVAARRERTVAAIRRAQLARVADRDRAPWRKRLLFAAIVLLPSGALAATWMSAGGRAPGFVVASASGAAASASDAPRKIGARGVAAQERVGAAPETDPPAAPASVAAEAPPVSARQPARTLAPSAKTSSLAEENALLEAALASGRRGDDAREIQLLGEFLRRFPRSELAQNAEVERFRALSRRGDTVTAARLARRYLGDHPDGMARDEARRLAVEEPASSGSLP